MFPCVHIYNYLMQIILKAQEDAEKLRSVVMPMEHEIAALKAKLATAEEKVKELEASKVSQQEIDAFAFCFCFYLNRFQSPIKGRITKIVIKTLITVYF